MSTEEAPESSASWRAYERARRYLVSNWVRSSTSRTSIVTKRAVKEEFGIDGLIYETRPFTIASGEVQEMRPVVRRMYEETQEDLRRRGITSVRLYRGVKTDVIGEGVISSWTSDKDTARKYGGYGILLEEVTADRIFMYHEGPGWINGPRGDEFEFIILMEAPR